MYRMCHKITVGNYKLLLLESVNIVRSVDALADTATIVLPGMVHNEAINIEDKIHVGDAVCRCNPAQRSPDRKSVV